MSNINDPKEGTQDESTGNETAPQEETTSEGSEKSNSPSDKEAE